MITPEVKFESNINGVVEAIVTIGMLTLLPFKRL